MTRTYHGVWRVEWSNPYVAPSGARELAQHVVRDWPNRADKSPPQRLVCMANQLPGYALTWSMYYDADYKPRRWSKEAKARNRLRRLRERIERKYPLFAEQMIAEAIAANPAYYAAEDPHYDQQEEDT